MTSRRHHAWSEPNRTVYRTERVCVHCELVKVTRHDGPGRPWTEWWRGAVQIFVSGTPECTAIAKAAA